MHVTNCSFSCFLQSGHNSIDSMGYAGTKKQIFAKTCIYKVSVIYFLSLIYEIASLTFFPPFPNFLYTNKALPVMLQNEAGKNDAPGFCICKGGEKKADILFYFLLDKLCLSFVGPNSCNKEVGPE